MPENEVVGEIINCDNLYIAKVTQDNDSGYVTGVPEYLAPTAEVKHDPKVSSASSDVQLLHRSRRDDDHDLRAC
jgi:hypothetical protein